MQHVFAARFLLAFIALWGCVVAAFAQTQSEQPIFPLAPTGPILTVEPDRLFTSSLFGIRVAQEQDLERDALLNDKSVIEAQLEEEEEQLTEQRDTMPAQEFAVLADAFDEKVQQLRRDQLQRSRAFTAKFDRARQDFFRFSLPILAEIVRTSGAVAILERRTVFLAADSIDITALAIERINQELGDGADRVEPQ